MIQFKVKIALVIIICVFVKIGLIASEKGSFAENITIEESDPVTDVDGNIYKTIKIGDQIWMAENLKTEHYTDGSVIESFAYNSIESNIEVFGRLYSSVAIAKQGVAPEGWHIPTESEWKELANYLGGFDQAGGKLKSTDSEIWNLQNVDSDNNAGFNAIPAGMYDFTKVYQWGGYKACFSSSSVGSRGNIYFYIENGSAELKIGQFHPDDAVSVRCIKD